jgi:hypothetical protein
VKRRYVFQIVYGLYSVEMALLHDQLRNVAASLRESRDSASALERVLTDTPWSNRADLIRTLERARI